MRRSARSALASPRTAFEAMGFDALIPYLRLCPARSSRLLADRGKAQDRPTQRTLVPKHGSFMTLFG